MVGGGGCESAPGAVVRCLPGGFGAFPGILVLLAQSHLVPFHAGRHRALLLVVAADPRRSNERWNGQRGAAAPAQPRAGGCGAVLGALASSQRDTRPRGIDPAPVGGSPLARQQSPCACCRWGSGCRKPPGWARGRSPPPAGGGVPPAWFAPGGPPCVPAAPAVGRQGSEEDAGRERGNASPKGTGPLTACRDGGKPELSNPAGIPGCV